MLNTQFNTETKVISFEDFLESSTKIEQISPHGKKHFMNAFTATPV